MPIRLPLDRLLVPVRQIGARVNVTNLARYASALLLLPLSPSDGDWKALPHAALLRALYERSDLYRKSGGVHTSIFVEAHGEAPRFVAEDIGRHNTLDKLQGMALLEGIPTQGGLIMASGRISSEMLFKAAIMGVPIVGSRTSPTNLALAVAERLNITVCGYVRQGSMNVYTHPQRIAA